MNVAVYPKAIVCEIHGPSDGYDTNEMINCNMNCRPTPLLAFRPTVYARITFATSPLNHGQFPRHIKWHVWKMTFKFIISIPIAAPRLRLQLRLRQPKFSILIHKLKLVIQSKPQNRIVTEIIFNNFVQNNIFNF